MNQLIARFLRSALLSLTACTPLAMAQDVAILGVPAFDHWNDDVVAKVSAAGNFDSVTGILGSGVTPTVNELMTYDAVLIYSDFAFLDADALGDNLADYVDLGGTVVIAYSAFSNTLLGIGGRLASGAYLPFTQGPHASPGGLSLVPVIVGHPLLNGVNSLDGGNSSFHGVISIDNGATLVAEWSNGQPLVGVLHLDAGTVVGLNFYPPSSDVHPDFWVASTDGGQLMANALSSQAPPGGPAIPVPTTGPGGLAILGLMLLLVGGLAYRRLA